MLMCRLLAPAGSLSKAKAKFRPKPSILRFSPLHSSSTRRNTSKAFDYNTEYFASTKFRLEVDEETGNRSIFAAEDLPPNEILIITPYYNQVVYFSSLPHFCNACHDSLKLSGLSETALRSSFIKSHLYCSEACKARGEPLDEVISKPLRFIQKKDPDFYISYTDKIRLVLYTLARQWLETQPKPTKAPAAPTETDEEDSTSDRLGRPFVLKEDSLVFADFQRLCQIDLDESNRFLSPKVRDAFLHVNERMKILLFDSPLMKLGTTPAEILSRNAANSFAIDKYDHLDPARAEKFGLNEPSGEAVFPLASYFNHNCMPNCSFTLDMNANIVVSTTKVVPADEELTISYSANNIKSPTKAIQSERNLRQRCKKFCRDTWTFECNCYIP